MEERSKGEQRTLNDAGLLDIPDGTSLDDVPDVEPLDSLVL
jgi:hypothetical protein